VVHVPVYFSTLDLGVEVDNGLLFDSESILNVLVFGYFSLLGQNQPEWGTPQIDLIIIST
jgi:hypothetical protein